MSTDCTTRAEFSATTDLTVVVLTHNESARLPRCLRAIPPRYPVLVVDSGSTDGTVEAARSAGCAVVETGWPGFAAQRNFALAACGVLSPWVLFVDADELYPPGFFAWFEDEGRHRDDFDIGMVTSWLVFRGITLRHAPGYPIHHPRLARRGSVVFVPNHQGHGETVAPPARPLRIDIPYRHEFYDGDMAGWMSKHVALARQEALADAAPDHGAGGWRLWLRAWAWRLPLRPPLRFLYHYLICGGLRDGRAGLEYALLYGWYEMTIALLKLSYRNKPKQCID